jgi:hypothetical protein
VDRHQKNQSAISNKKESERDDYANDFEEEVIDDEYDDNL